jgi:hypothetical protein
MFNNVASGFIKPSIKGKHVNQITIPAADMKQALSGLHKVVGHRSSLPALQSLKLSRNTEGHPGS